MPRYAIVAALLALAVAPAAADTPDACLAGTTPQVVSGAHTSAFRPSVSDGKTFDARGASFTNPGTYSWRSVDLGAASDMCWVGGYFTNALSWHLLDASWDLSKHGVSTGGRNTTSAHAEGAARVTWSGIHVYNGHDGIRFNRSLDGWTLQHAWFDYIRDDCIENDHIADGTIRDSLFDGCYVFYSERSPNSDPPGVITVDGALVRMEPMPHPYKDRAQLSIDGTGFGGGPVWKMNSAESTIHISNSVFMVEYSSGRQMLPENIGTCRNNTMIWLDTDDPVPSGLDPACWTVIIDPFAGRQLWGDRVAGWHARHPQVGANRKPANPGSYAWPRFGIRHLPP